MTPAPLLYDTTYFLPLAGIEVTGPAAEALRKARSSGREVWVSEISMFELLAKGAKFAEAGKVEGERVSLAVRAVMEDERIRKAPAYEGRVASTSVSLRRFHRDFVDCLIIASALEHCEGMVSEEDFRRNGELLRFVRDRKPGFRFVTSKDLAGGG